MELEPKDDSEWMLNTSALTLFCYSVSQLWMCINSPGYSFHSYRWHIYQCNRTMSRLKWWCRLNADRQEWQLDRHRRWPTPSLAIRSPALVVRIRQRKWNEVARLFRRHWLTTVRPCRQHRAHLPLHRHLPNSSRRWYTKLLAMS